MYLVSCTLEITSLVLHLYGPSTGGKNIKDPSPLCMIVGVVSKIECATCAKEVALSLSSMRQRAISSRSINKLTTEVIELIILVLVDWTLPSLLVFMLGSNDLSHLALQRI